MTKSDKKKEEKAVPENKEPKLYSCLPLAKKQKIIVHSKIAPNVDKMKLGARLKTDSGHANKTVKMLRV